MTSVTTADVLRGTPAVSLRRRLLYVDNIRTVLITLLVMGHLAITYGGVGSWYYRESGPVSEVFTIIMLPLGAILSASMLGLFCLVAGYFTPQAYDRKGPGPFLVDRLKRLAIPLAVYELLINPAIWYLRDVHQGSFQGAFTRYFPLYPSLVKSMADGPVWFLAMLLAFSAVYAGWRLLGSSLVSSMRQALPAAPGNGRIALFAVVLAGLTFAVRLWAPVGKLYEPWHQELAHYPQYALMFVAGILAYRGDWLSTYPAHRARLWLWLMPLVVLSLGGVAAASGAFSGALDDRAAGGANWLSLAYSTWEAWTCVVVTIVMLTWFRARFDRQGPLAREMSASAFGVYVLHPAVIVPMALAASGIAMDLSLKFLLVTPVAIALCYLCVAALRRLPGVRSML